MRIADTRRLRRPRTASPPWREVFRGFRAAMRQLSSSRDAPGHARLTTLMVNWRMALPAGAVRRVFGIWSLLTAVWCGAQTGSPEPVHKLPPFVVTEAPEELPWQYGAVDGFEVLSLSDEDLTRNVLQGYRRGCWFAPPALMEERSAPVQFVFWEGGAVQVAPATKVDRPDGSWTYRGFIDRSDRDRLLIAANLNRIYHYDSANTGVALWFLRERTPPLPAWLLAGLEGRWGAWAHLNIMVRWEGEAKLRYHVTDRIKTKRLNEHADFRELMARREGFIPWAEFFGAPPPDESVAPEQRARWDLQAGIFVRWGQFGDGNTGRRALAFWRFVAEAASGPVTEAMFVRAFGMNFARADAELRRYLRRAAAQDDFIEVPRLGHDVEEFKDFRLRSATEGEIARLKGNFERMEMNALRATHPDLAAKYEQAVRRTIRRGLRLAANDARVHELAGLVEYETGHAAAARPHLEYAFAHGGAGTRALLALARVRLADLSAGRTADDRLPAEVLERVLTPLFAAKDRRPALAEVYRCIGDVWERSANAPLRGHLAVLAEGVALFPDDAELRLQAARLHGVYGFEREAAALIDEGVRRAATAETRAKFAHWRTFISSTQPPP